MKSGRIITLIALLFSTFIVNAQEQEKSNSLLNRHNFALDLGYAYRFSSKPNELFVNQKINKDHYSSLRHGIQINFAYDYLYKPFLAFGFKTSAFNSSNSFISDKRTKTNAEIECKDDEYIFYLGPSVKYLFPTFNNKYNVYARGTIGYMSFRNSETKVVTDTISKGFSTTYTGSTFGWGLDLGLDYTINDFLSAGCNIGLLGGSVGKLNVGEDKFKLKTNENLYRLDITVGLRIKL